MTAKTHMSAGLLTGLLAAAAIPSVGAKCVVATASILGSLIPDIDIRESKISYALTPIHYIHKGIEAVAKLIAKIMPKKVGYAIERLFSHRGITHSIFYALLIGFASYLVGFKVFAYPLELSVGITVGITSHIVMDMISGGAMALAPLYCRRITFGRIKTNSVTEYVVMGALYLLCTFVGVKLITVGL